MNWYLKLADLVTNIQISTGFPKVPIYINPNLKEWVNAMGIHKYARIIAGYNQNLYIWDGYELDHSLVSRKIDIDGLYGFSQAYNQIVLLNVSDPNKKKWIETIFQQKHPAINITYYDPSKDINKDYSETFDK